MWKRKIFIKKKYFSFVIKEFHFIFALPNWGIEIIFWPIRLVVRTPGFHPGNRSSILLWATRITKEIWPIRLVVRTPGFHPGNRSSILLWATKLNKTKSVEL